MPGRPGSSADLFITSSSYGKFTERFGKLVLAASAYSNRRTFSTALTPAVKCDCAKGSYVGAGAVLGHHLLPGWVHPPDGGLQPGEQRACNAPGSPNSQFNMENVYRESNFLNREMGPESARRPSSLAEIPYQGLTVGTLKFGSTM